MGLSSAVNIYLLILTFIFGSCIGSFVACAADRYIAGGSVLKGRSYCPACGHTLSAIELIPIFSFLFLRGKCRHCGARIPARCLYTEILGGAIFLTIAIRFVLDPFALHYHWGREIAVTAQFVLLVFTLLAMSLIDFDTMEIPDGLTAFGVVIFAVFLPAYSDPFARIENGLLGAVILGGGMFVISLILNAVLKRDSLGFGDVKLLGMLGLFTGVEKGILLIIFSCFIGLMFSVFSKNSDKEFPFAPSISFAAWITILFGSDIVNFYLSLF